MTLRTALLACPVVLALLLAGGGAGAADCPPGSVSKEENGQTWCEPSLCDSDAQCKPGEICRLIPLCVQVGAMEKRPGVADAGQRLMVTQRCAPDQTCPQTTVCSEKTRCVSREQADKMGVLTVKSTPAGSASGAASATPTSSADAKKSSCGCHVVGESGGARNASLGLAAVALAFGAASLRRRRR